MEREHERSIRERERDNEMREQDSARFKQWSKQEETFHLEQARLRSKIRLKVRFHTQHYSNKHLLRMDVRNLSTIWLDIWIFYRDVTLLILNYTNHTFI